MFSWCFKNIFVSTQANELLTCTHLVKIIMMAVLWVVLQSLIKDIHFHWESRATNYINMESMDSLWTELDLQGRAV